MTFVPSLLAIGLGILALVFFSGVRPAAPAQVAGALRAAASNSGTLASFFAPSVLRWSGSVESWAQEYGLDANLIATVMQIESCGDPQASSSAGAQGLFQVMPFHFLDGENPRDPGTNALRGLSYLKQSLDAAQGDVRRALAGYNGGIGMASQPEGYWPAETRRYADWGSRIYAEASQGAGFSSALQDWLDSGGLRLCRQAKARLMIYAP